MSADITSESRIEPLKICLFLIHRGVKALGSNLQVAEKAFAAAMHAANKAPNDQVEQLTTLVICHQALMEYTAGHSEAGNELRGRAMPLVDRIAPEKQSDLFDLLMLSVLYNLKEYWRAIRFCEQTIIRATETEGPSGIIELLQMQARCYIRSGLEEQASVPLRAVLQIIRAFPGDPRLPSALNDLGNTVRKSAPSEAEQLFREAAALYEEKAHMESATVPWVNLGTLYAEQGRYAESLKYYQQALQIRERLASASPRGLGILLNNMANCYRRSREFDEALRLVDRAIEILDSHGSEVLPSAYATRGEILHDAGKHHEAVEWFQRSYEERQKAPNPNLSKLAQNLELEIKSLRALGREEDARVAEERLSAARDMKERAPQANLNLAPMNQHPAASVLIELSTGRRSSARYNIRDAEVVGDQIAAILEAQKLGTYEDRVVIPESTTLIFHGQNAEEMFGAMEQFLSDHSIFAGATVSIRQGTALRQLVVPQTLN